MKLGDLCDVVRGSSPRPQGDPKYFGGNIPRLMIADITRDGKYVTPIIDSLTEEGAKKSRPMKKGDVVIAVSGDPGRPCILAIDACIHDGFVGLRNVDENKILKTYLFCFLNYFKITNQKNAVGAIFQNLTTDQIKKIEIPEISINNQKKIVQILDQTEKLLSQRKESIILLDELLQNTFLDMFGDPIMNEKGWNKSELKKITLKIGSGSTPRGGKEIYEKEGISLVRSLNVYDNEFKYENLAFINNTQAEKLKNVELFSNDVLFNITGASICRCTVVPNNVLPARVNQHVSIIRPNPKILNSKFLSNLLISDNAKRKLLSIGSSGGAIMQAITKEQLQKFKIPIPPIELQNQYGLIFEKVELVKKDYVASLQELENMYGVLSQKAFKGALNLSKVDLEIYKEEIKTPVAGSIEPQIEVENLPGFPEKERHIKEMSLDEYYGIPEDIIAKYGSIEENHQDWEFLLKKFFHNSPVDLSRLEEIYHKLYYRRGHDFEFEEWKAFIFEELSKSKSFLKQKFNTETNQLELLINEIKKS